MNYGRYFRLNQALSKVVDGVAIYDYIDLPAYFGPSVDNPMSPKYPISVTITADTVCFRLHYSAFKIENKIQTENPRYAYDRDDINNKAFTIEDGKCLNQVGMAHMEEIVLELPFQDVTSTRLSDTIKSIYNTRFPQVEDENISMGGRYLEQLIRRRYPLKNDEIEENNIEIELYKRLREVTDNTASYSTLWLMDLIKKRRINIYQEANNKQSNDNHHYLPIVGFLRKLLLDFMFDLKHSDVFQNSANYQKMFSGLMSDFYFSALMHKCEYYYHRKLIREAINQEGGYNRDAIVTLYAEELFRAEELWTKDVMSADAEEQFYYKDISFWQEFKEDCVFKKYPSWFADPEEEMRRICFTMREKEGKQERHMCNMDVLVRLLNIRRDSNSEKNNQIEQNMFKMRDDTFEQISKWFLKRYDFKDLFHLHMFKYANSSLIAVLVISLLLLMPFIGMDLRYIVICCGTLFFIINFLRWFYIYQKNPDEKYEIDKKRNAMALNRIKGTCFISGILTFIFALGFFPVSGLWDRLKDYVSNLSTCMLCVLSALIVAPVMVITPWESLRWKKVKEAISSRVFPVEPKLQHIMSNLHLLLPRLVASIAASWITLSMGFDLYVSFFDARPSWETILILLVILLLFVMFEVNRVTPNSNSWLKLYRSVELIVISYTISLIIGFVVINFLGERFLEKGGYVGENEFYTQYVENKVGFKDVKKEKRSPLKIAPYKSNVNKLDSVYHFSKDGKIGAYPVIEHISFFEWDVLVLRDFLIMFAFVTMFMGIFIQLIILGDSKQMTEL